MTGAELFAGEPMLTAMIGAHWVEDPEGGYLPVLTSWASREDIPDDGVLRRVLIMPSGRVYQIPIAFSTVVHVGDA